ncbi:hypothetical protein FQN49_000129 [Arthroderma sp. PD_2]|nr:hypothetical protein FQN49_000129 [Arthroderma sp. PD_2]
MCAVASPKHKWPPAPRVEDVLSALSYEVSDASLSSNIEDDDSVVSRGTIDQWPIILPVETPGSCNQSTQNNECFISRKIAAETDMPVFRKASDSTANPPSLKRSQSERRPPSKVRFSEPPGRDEHSRIRTGPVPSKANLKYTPEPKSNASGKDIMSSQRFSSKSHRKAMIPGPEGSRSQGTNSSLGYSSQQNVTRHPAVTSSQYSADELDNRSDFSGSWKSFQQSDISTDSGSRKAHRRQHAGEWHSDDEISSSYRSAHKSKYWRPTLDEFLRQEAHDTRSTRKSRNDYTPEQTPRQSGSTRRRKPMATEELYSYIPESNKGKSSSKSERRRSNSSLPRLERSKLDTCTHRYLDPTDRSSSDPTPNLPATSTGMAYEGALAQQTTFPPISFDQSGQDYNPEGWEYVSPPACYECNGHDAPWPAPTYLPTIDIPPQLPYIGYQENPLQLAPGPSSTFAGQESMSRGTIVPQRQVSPRRRCEEAPASLAPCPRSIAIADYGDWSSIMGLTHLNICPSCTQQIEQTRFERLIIAAPVQPLGLPIRCSFSQPWARLAWVQTMKLGLNHLELLYQLTRPSSIYKHCPGRTPSTQTWYRVIDPETGRLMPNFNACASCFRNVRILMPSLRDSFQPTSTSQERTCDLRCGSTRFIQYLDLLDVAATRHRHSGHKPDLRDFIRYARRKNRLYDCPRDHLVVGPWHGIDELPEFTVCEDCYDDVVWPYGNSPVASLVSQTVQMTPDKKARATRQASCQLYSPRMRMMFREAVRRSDFGYLRAAVVARYQAETAFRENKKLLLEDVSMWYDRDAELRKNAAEWKRWE